ncbi:MAG: alpha-2-macroglobulin family protein [Verrucomicrobiales bacterium]|jgi:uncharacterized repeat protein (TIGR01451 family)|nr:alpha-2-macroglobulin family protein [Verrucomicrobiales bacterium]
MESPTPSPLEKFIGKLNWQPPFWLRNLKEHPKKLVGPAIILASLANLLVISVHLSSRPPDPEAVIAGGSVPELSPVDENGIHPQGMSVEFSKSALKLELIDKVVEQGIRMTPALKGIWRCNSDSILYFEPEEDWAAGTRYQVSLDKSLFADGVKLAKYEVEFKTRPFAVSVDEAKFYLNPKNPETRQITATLNFNYPVDQKTLEKALSLTGKNVHNLLIRKGSEPEFTVELANHGRTAYFRSAPLNLPEKPSYAKIEVAKGFAPLSGKGLAKAANSEVMIPDLYGFLKISSPEFVIINNANGDPQQTLTFQTGVGVDNPSLQKKMTLWLLPKDKPANGDEEIRRDYRWQSPAEIGDPALLGAKKLDIKLNPVEQDFAELHSVTLDLPPGRYVYLTIDKDLKGFGGFILKDNFATVLRVPNYPKEVRVMSDGAVLAQSGERKLSVLTRGLKRVEFRLAKVSPDQINHLVSQSSGSFQNPYFRNYEFGEDNISKVFYKTVSVDGSDNAKADYLTLDLNEMLGKYNTEARGLFFLECKEQRGTTTTPEKLATPYPDSQPDYGAWANQSSDSPVKDRRFILVTDLGIVVKDNADGTQDVFVQSIKTGEPVSGAAVSVLGKNGEPVANSQTDANGHAKLPRVLDLKREKRPVAFLVQKGGDLSFLPFNRADRKLNFSNYNTGGLELTDPKTLSVFLFSERGLYRPGDDVHLALIAKQYDWSGNLDGIPLELEITNPTGAVARTEKLKLNKASFLTTLFTPNHTAPTGTYYASIYFVNANGDRDKVLGSTSFRVEEFLPDRLKIKAALTVNHGEGWVSPKDLAISVNLQNLYGAVAENHRINGELTLTPASYAFGHYPDYAFYDPDADPDKKPQTYRENLEETTTDANGDATLKLNISRFDQGVYRLSYFVRGFEQEGGRNVSAAGDTLVSGRDYLVGSKPDGDLSYLRLNSEHRVSFLAVSADLQPRTVENLKLKLAEERYISALTKNADGNYSYQSVLKEYPVSEQDLAISAKGYDYTLPTKDPGNYVVRIFDANGDTLSVVRFNVVGNANLSRSLEKNAELKLKLSKNEYKSGESIQLAITAPYTGSGLITIEQDKVYVHKWFKTNTSSSTQSITLPDGIEGNAYVTVTFLRSLDSTEIFTSPLSSAVAAFNINRDKRTTKITLTTPEKARPGKPFVIHYQTDRPAKILIYAVDEGILQVAHYSLPDPLGHFLEKRALQVGTSQILDQILPEYSILRKIAAAGGDGGEDELTVGLNPFKRKAEKPVVYWSGILDANNKDQSVTYDVPDYFNGTLRVMAVAVSEDSANSAEQKSFIQGPLIIQPNVPTFVAPGDEFEVTVSVANNIEKSGPDAKVNVNLAVSGGLQLVDKAANPTVIAEGKDASLRYKLKATDTLGNAELVFSADANGESARYVSTLSVRPSSAFQTRIRGGMFTGGSKDIQVERDLYPQFRDTRVNASLLPLGLLRGVSAYFQYYPYYCTEQLSSSAFSTLLLDKDTGVTLTTTEREKALAKVVNILRTRQNDQGAFGLWRPVSDLHFDFPSIYAMHFLTEAKEHGYDIPSDLFRRGLAHLEDIVQDTPQNSTDARQQAYAIYILTRNQKVTTNYLDRLVAWLNANDKKQLWRNDLTGLYCAATYAMLHNSKDANLTISGFKLQKAPKLRMWDDFYSDLGRNAQYLYLVAKHFPDRLGSVSAEDLQSIAAPVARGEFVTHSAAYAILGLKSYADAVGGNNAFTISVAEKRANGQSQPLTLSAGLCPSGSFSPDAKALTINSNTARTFYQVIEAGFDKQPSDKPLRQGIEVQREYHDRNNKVVSGVELGGELTVHVKIRSTSNIDVTNVAILDLLPGGFEVVADSIRDNANNENDNGNGNLYPEYVDIREDRVVIHCHVSPEAREFIYQIRATNRGSYQVPPVQAESLYRRDIQARGKAGSITVEDAAK